jgi:2'-5' RNA ligase
VRLFVAVRPPATVLDAVAALPRPEQAGVRWTTRDQWHITLRFLGELDSPDEVSARLASAMRAARPTEAVLGPAVSVLGAGLACVRVAGLDDLAAAVVAATADLGRPPREGPFTGHLTLARLRRGSGNPRRLAGAPISASWPVTEVELVRSHLHPTGARHDALATFPLGGA